MVQELLPDRLGNGSSLLLEYMLNFPQASGCRTCELHQRRNNFVNRARPHIRETFFTVNQSDRISESGARERERAVELRRGRLRAGRGTLALPRPQRRDERPVVGVEIPPGAPQGRGGADEERVAGLGAEAVRR